MKTIVYKLEVMLIGENEIEMENFSGEKNLMFDWILGCGKWMERGLLREKREWLFLGTRDSHATCKAKLPF